MKDTEADYIGPLHGTLGSVPDLAEAKRSLRRLLFERYEVTPQEIRAIQAELAADRLDGRRCETTIAGVIEHLRGGVYTIPIGTQPMLIENWLCHYIRPGLVNDERRELARWLAEALRQAERLEEP